MMTSSDTQHLDHLRNEIAARLQEGEVEAAKRLASEIVASREAPVQWLRELERLFGRRLDALVEVLWTNKDTALNDVAAIGHFMRFCNKTGVYDRFGPALRSWIASESSSKFTFSESGHFRHFRELTGEQQKDFADAKYRRWRDFASQDFFHALDAFSVFATVSPPIRDFLFENRADKEMTFVRWMRDFQSSEMLKHIVADMRTINRLIRKGRSGENDKLRYPHLRRLIDLIDLDNARALFAKLDLSKGLLLCSLHDAHLILAKRCAGHCMPERIHLGLRAGPRGIAVGKDSDRHLSSFKAIKALQARKMLLMVADGGAHKATQTSEAKVLGTPVTFADGAPTFAFESGSATGWYTMARRGDCFVPVFEPGPSREPKESFKNFKDRWWAFYAGELEKLFTGDPRNITLWFHWPKLFRSATSVPSFGGDDDNDFEDDDAE